MKIVGHAIMGPGERYAEKTLEQFKSLTDETIILLNNGTEAEEKLVGRYGFRFVRDDREWGRNQHRIKRDFVRNHVAKLKPDACLTLDMDESFPEDFTRRDLEQLTQWHSTAFYFIQHWDTPERYNPDMGFWSVRFYRWTGDTEWLDRPLQCGLVPKWALDYCSYAPWYIHHYGLMLPEDRQRKIARYKKYDPESKYLPSFYEKLRSATKGEVFDKEAFKQKIINEVSRYGDQIKTMSTKNEQKFWYVKNPHGQIIDVPDRHLQDTLAKPGYTLLSKDPIVLSGDGVKTTIISKPALAQIKEEVVDEAIKQEAEHPTPLLCLECGFEAKNTFGLRGHMRKHNAK